jgi:hypothetical protein
MKLRGAILGAKEEEMIIFRSLVRLISIRLQKIYRQFSTRDQTDENLSSQMYEDR